MRDNLKAYAAFMEKLAEMSGDSIRTHYRNLRSIEDKSDNSPVTVADRQAEAIMREMIGKTYPDHGIIGEEYGIENADADYVWVLDPIDGTVSFTIGRPIFGTLIALMFRGMPLLGMVHQPILNERWIGGEGITASFNGKAIHTSGCMDITNAVIATSAPNYFKRQEWEIYQQVETRAKRFVYGGDCYNYALLASGRIDIVIETGLKPHDFCALAPIITAAGGIMTDWEGKTLSANSDGRVIACATEALHRQVVEMVRGFGIII